MDGESFITAKHLFLPIDAQKVIKRGTLPLSRAGEILPQINIETNNRLTKSDLMVIELLKENNWKRPLYFATSIGGEYMGLMDHFELTGLTYQVLPIGLKGSGSSVNTDEVYTNLMTKFKYGGIENKKVYLDQTVLNMCLSHRRLLDN